jgi:hypothetical protein
MAFNWLVFGYTSYGTAPSTTICVARLLSVCNAWYSCSSPHLTQLHQVAVYLATVPHHVTQLLDGLAATADSPAGGQQRTGRRGAAAAACPSHTPR